MKKDICNIIFGGIGGQGILKASEITGQAAMFGGKSVKKSEVHGMAQRGGSVESHLRFGERVYSPLISKGEADFLVCFHRDEHSRLKPFLSTGGTDLLEYLEQAEDVIENPRFLNTCLVGVLAGHLGISEKHWIKALETVFPAKYLEQNKKVFNDGKNLVKK